MAESTTLPREVVELEDLDGRFASFKDVPRQDVSVTVDDLLEAGVTSFDEVELARLPVETVRELVERVDEVSDRGLGVLKDVAERGQFYGVFARRDGDCAGAWYDLGLAIRKEIQDNRYECPVTLQPVYESVVGVPSSVGCVASRLLSGWIVKMEMMPSRDSNSRNPETVTVVASVGSEVRLSEDTKAWRGKLSNELGWRLKGIGEHEGDVFAIAPVEPGEDTTVWPEESFTNEWGEPWYPVEMTAYPSKRAFEDREEEEV